MTDLNTNFDNENISQIQLLMEFFQNNPNRNIRTPEIVDWVTSEYQKRTGKIYRDPDRGIRRLYQDGYLIKENNGIYRYDPSMVEKRELEDFTPEMKQAIFAKDGYKCAICGMGPANGVTIYADHIKAKDSGGKATLENGQTLCGHHNFLKKNFKQTETGKRMFIHLYEQAKSLNDEELVKFCTDILEVYEKDNINGHIVWTK